MNTGPGEGPLTGGYVANYCAMVGVVRVWWAGVVLVVLLLSACGGSSGGRLSASEYRAHLKTVGAESNSAQHAVAVNGLHAKSVPQLVKALTAFVAAQKRIGDEVAALKPPKDAEAANAELANGLHHTAAVGRAALPRVKKMPSMKAALTYLSKEQTTKGGHEIDHALAQLKQLGYINSVS